jgi:hypothetical protein
VWTLSELARARGVTKPVAYRWLRNLDMLVEVGRDKGGNPRWGTTLPLLLDRAPEIWTAIAAKLLAGGRCPSCGQPVPRGGR